jgi:hypothetical protein
MVIGEPGESGLRLWDADIGIPLGADLGWMQILLHQREVIASFQGSFSHFIRLAYGDSVKSTTFQVLKNPNQRPQQGWKFRNAWML